MPQVNAAGQGLITQGSGPVAGVLRTSSFPGREGQVDPFAEFNVDTDFFGTPPRKPKPQTPASEPDKSAHGGNGSSGTVGASRAHAAGEAAVGTPAAPHNDPTAQLAQYMAGQGPLTPALPQQQAQQSQIAPHPGSGQAGTPAGAQSANPAGGMGHTITPFAQPSAPSRVYPSPIIATGTDVGAQPLVKVFDALTGQLKYQFLAYDASFHGGVRVAMADLTGDGMPEIITAPGPGMAPQVRVFDGRDGTLWLVLWADSWRTTHHSRAGCTWPREWSVPTATRTSWSAPMPAAARL